jgi:thioredoxin-related protein
MTLLVGVGVLGALRDNHISTDIAWAPGFAAGQAQARRVHRPMLLSFSTPGCGWCAKMDAETFTDPRVLDLSRRFVCVRLDSTVDDAIAWRYGVIDTPTTVLTDEQGKSLTQFSGYVPPDRFASVLRIVEKNRAH